MIIETITKFNFLDFILLIVFFRICYIAAKLGLSVELFKLFGTIFSIYIALHYYTGISDFIQRSLLPKGAPLEFVDFIVFLLLILSAYLCFVVLRNVLGRFIQLNAVPKINQFFGLILGIVRGLLIVGLLSYLLVISSITYLGNSVKYSYLGSRAFVILPQTYGWLWKNITSKFSVQEKFNHTVTQTTEKFNRK